MVAECVLRVMPAAAGVSQILEPVKVYVTCPPLLHVLQCCGRLLLYSAALIVSAAGEDPDRATLPSAWRAAAAPAARPAPL